MNSVGRVDLVVLVALAADLVASQELSMDLVELSSPLKLEPFGVCLACSKLLGVESDLVGQRCCSIRKGFELEPAVVVVAVDAAGAFVTVVLAGLAGCLACQVVAHESLTPSSYSKVGFEQVDDTPLSDFSADQVVACLSLNASSLLE